ncbi:MAG: AAA family ATPase [Paracoccaceae bacterium]
MTAPHSPPDQIARMAAYVCTDAGAQTARDVMTAMGADLAAIYGGGLSGAARISTDRPLAQTVLAELGQLPQDAACECVAEIARSGATVIVLGQTNSLVTYRALLQAGASDYFAFPVQTDEVVQAATPAPAPAPAAPDHPVAARSLRIAVVGCNGGVGASLLAQNLAYLASAPKAAAYRTALIDADLRFGTQAVDLDRADTPGLFEALSAPERVDETFLNVTMEKLTDTLSLYAHQVRPGQSLATLEAALPRLVRSVTACFEAVIVDLPRNVLFDQPEMAEAFDAIILVVPAGYAGVNAASRLMASLRADAPSTRLLPVLSTLRTDAGLALKDIEKSIAQPVITTLPRNDTGLRRAHLAAKPLIQMQPRGPYAKALQTLWQHAITSTNPAPSARSAPWTLRLLGKAVA